MLQNFSSIQNSILAQLKNARSLRYGELKPDGVPNDLFNYHLQHLVKKGFVDRYEDGYSLSVEGIKHVADPYTTNDAITSLFKINVITLVSRVVNGKIEILNQLRMSNPSYGKVGAPGGVVLKGERIEHAATRKLKQETGLDALFQNVGCERRIMYKGGELFSDLMFPVAYTDNATGDLISETQFGKNMWVPIDQAIENESAEFDSLEGIRVALEAIKKGTIKKLPYYFLENIQSDSVDIPAE